jgi:hypothetical protein
VYSQDNDELVLANDHSPDKYELQVMALRHLAQIDENGIGFGLSWTFDQVDEKLRQIFPELFEYLDTLSPDTEPLDDKPLPPWLLCFRQRNSLKLVPDLFPTGHVLDFNKGTTRAGYRQSNVFIGVSEFNQRSGSTLTVDLFSYPSPCTSFCH